MERQRRCLDGKEFAQLEGMSKRGRLAAGFSLVEVIVAMGLTAIIVTSLATVYVQALHKIASDGSSDLDGRRRNGRP